MKSQREIVGFKSKVSTSWLQVKKVFSPSQSQRWDAGGGENPCTMSIA